MDHVKYFEDSFQSIPDYRKNVLILLLSNNDVDLLNECVFLQNDINHLCLEFEKIINEQNEDCSEYYKTGNKVLSIGFLKTKWRNFLQRCSKI